MWFAFFQNVCVVVVALYALTHRDRWKELALLAVTAWLGEQTAIALYGFYAYDDSWLFFIGDVPVVIPLIWSVVIASARDLAGHTGWRRHVWVGGLVLTDAALIEPVCVGANLWTWTQPGILGVPVIGLIGWGLFGGLASAALDGPWRPVRLLAALLFLHLGLFASWWLGVRLLAFDLPVQAVAIIGVSLGAALFVALHLAQPSTRSVLQRMPGAVLVLVLIRRPALALWAAAFALPYTVQLAIRFLSGPVDSRSKEKQEERSGDTASNQPAGATFHDQQPVGSAPDRERP